MERQRRKAGRKAAHEAAGRQNSNKTLNTEENKDPEKIDWQDKELNHNTQNLFLHTMMLAIPSFFINRSENAWS